MFGKREVSVFVINGFLEGGKTTFIKEAIIGDPGMKKERVVIVCCEEGEIEYESLPSNIHVVTLEDKEQLTRDVFFKIDEQYKPTYVIIEYNSIWGMETLYSTPKPEEWKLVDQLTVIDGTTFEQYFTNMKNIFVDMLRTATNVIVNRCTRDDDFRFYKNNIRRCAPQANIMYVSDEEGIMDIMLEEDLPYNLNDPVISLDDDSFVIWYIDMLDNPQRYLGKTVQYVAMVRKRDYYRAGYFMAGNMVMTCCEDDMQYMGFLCKSEKSTAIGHGDYVRVRGEVRYEYAPEYGEEGPVLYAKKVIPIQNPQK